MVAAAWSSAGARARSCPCGAGALLLAALVFAALATLAPGLEELATWRLLTGRPADGQGGPPMRWVIVLLAADDASAHAQDATPAQIDRIRKNAVVCDTVKSGHGFVDLQPLRQLSGDARIVALGEPTHRSPEVFQTKHRLLAFLVEELVFTVFSIEANMPESFRLNHDVLRVQGDPWELIHVMGFWICATAEVREMVEWMRRHHAEAVHRERRSPVTFTGFDVQNPDVVRKDRLGARREARPWVLAARARAHQDRGGRAEAGAAIASERPGRCPPSSRGA